MFGLQEFILKHMRVMLAALAALVCIFVGIFAAASWLRSHDAAVLLSANASAQKQVIAQADASQQKRATVLAKTIASITAAKRKSQTPSEIVEELPLLLPELTTPISLPLPDEQTGGHTADVATIPQSELKPLYNHLQDCMACDVRLHAGEADLLDKQAQVKALTLQRDAALSAATGGKFWHRLKHNAKWFILGSAAGALALRALNFR